MQQMFHALSPRASAAPPAPSNSFVAPPSGRPYARLPVPKFTSMPLPTRQPFIQPVDDLRDVPWPASHSSPLAVQPDGDTFPPPPLPVSYHDMVSATTQRLPWQVPHPHQPPPQHVAELTDHMRSMHIRPEHSLSAPAPSFQVPMPEYMVPEDTRQFARLKLALENIRIHSRAPLEERPDRQRGARANQSPAARSTTVLFGCDPPVKAVEPTKPAQPPPRNTEQPKKYCPFCDDIQHYFNQCTVFKQLTKDQKVSWIKTGKRC